MLNVKTIAKMNPGRVVAGSALALGCVLFLVWALPAVSRVARLERGGRALQEARAFAEQHPSQHNPALDRALSFLQRAVQDVPEDGHAYRQLGQAWLLLGDNERAVAALSRAVELRPNHPLIHVELGYAYDGLGQVERALAAYEKGRYGPALEEAIVNYVKIADWRAAAGAGDVALGILEQVLELDPDNLPALYRSMTIYRGISEQANIEFAEPLREQLRELSAKEVAAPTEPRLAAYTAQTIARLVEEGIWTPEQAQE